MVEEYLSDSIASDSDDKRKLRAPESRALRKKQNSRKSNRCNNIYSATFNHRFRNVQQIQFHTQHSFSLPIINASRRTSSHTLTAATTTKTPLLHWSIKSLSNLLCVPENWALAKQLPVRKKFQKMKQNHVKISVLFCHLFILCLMILIQILTTLISTL